MAKEYFIRAQSFAAPFVSDTSTGFAVGETPADALEGYTAAYQHPAGLYSAGVWASANDYHKGREPLARWLSNHAATIEDKTARLDGYSIRSDGPGSVCINNKTHKISNPKQGAVRS